MQMNLTLREGRKQVRQTDKSIHGWRAKGRQRNGSRRGKHSMLQLTESPFQFNNKTLQNPKHQLPNWSRQLWCKTTTIHWLRWSPQKAVPINVCYLFHLVVTLHCTLAMTTGLSCALSLMDCSNAIHLLQKPFSLGNPDLELQLLSDSGTVTSRSFGYPGPGLWSTTLPLW